MGCGRAAPAAQAKAEWLGAAARRPHNGRRRRGISIGRTTQVTPMPLCGTCHGCGLELAFPPVPAGEMGGWTASWPHGREDGLVYRRTCRGCHELGVTEPAANRPLSL